MARGFSRAPGASPAVIAASDPALTKNELLELGGSRNHAVRAAVAARPDCPLGLMVTLAHDVSVDVRVAVAMNDHAQRSVMQYLASDRAVPVVVALVSNPALPRDILEELAFHRQQRVRLAAAERIDADDRSAKDQRNVEPSTALAQAAADFVSQEVERMTAVDPVVPVHQSQPDIRLAPVRGFRAP